MKLSESGNIEKAIVGALGLTALAVTGACAPGLERTKNQTSNEANRVLNEETYDYEKYDLKSEKLLSYEMSLLGRGDAPLATLSQEDIKLLLEYYGKEAATFRIIDKSKQVACEDRSKFIFNFWLKVQESKESDISKEGFDDEEWGKDDFLGDKSDMDFLEEQNQEIVDGEQDEYVSPLALESEGGSEIISSFQKDQEFLPVMESEEVCDSDYLLSVFRRAYQSGVGTLYNQTIKGKHENCEWKVLMKLERDGKGGSKAVAVGFEDESSITGQCKVLAEKVRKMLLSNFKTGRDCGDNIIRMPMRF